MSCCGMKRASLAAPKTNLATATSRPSTAGRPGADARAAPQAFARSPSPPPASPPPSPAPGPGSVRLRYLARPAVLVRGTRSGASYRFSESQPVLAVQRADAQALLATGHFRRED